eukprot:761646-Hanusia_phi.AAC.2
MTEVSASGFRRAGACAGVCAGGAGAGAGGAGADVGGGAAPAPAPAPLAKSIIGAHGAPAIIVQAMHDFKVSFANFASRNGFGESPFTGSIVVVHMENK